MDEVDCKEWEDIEANAKHDSMRCAHHRWKFSDGEDGFNQQLKECVRSGRQLMFDWSHVASWYHSRMTIGHPFALHHRWDACIIQASCSNIRRCQQQGPSTVEWEHSNN
jgi:hypothetical protein